jgi:hypothetical protein
MEDEMVATKRYLKRNCLSQKDLDVMLLNAIAPDNLKSIKFKIRRGMIWLRFLFTK